MEYYAGGSLCDYIQSNGKLSEADAKKYTAQMMNGLQYIHSQVNLKCSSFSFESIRVFFIKKIFIRAITEEKFFKFSPTEGFKLGFINDLQFFVTKDESEIRYIISYQIFLI